MAPPPSPASVDARPGAHAARQPARYPSGAPGGFEGLWQLATDLFAIADDDGLLYALNPAWERTLGWSLEQLSAQPLTAFVHPEDLAATVAILARTGTAGERIDDVECRWRRRDGAYRTLSWSGATDGDVWSVVGRDVTGRARERTMLREAQRILELINWEWNLGSDHVTTAFAGDTPPTTSGLVGLLARVAPEDRATVSDGLAALRAGTVEESRMEHRVVAPDGQVRWLDTRCRVLRDDDGAPLPTSYTAAPLVTANGLEGCVVVFTDATERQAEHRELRRKLDALSWAGRVQDALREERFVLYAQPILDLRSGRVIQHELLLRVREPDGTIAAPGAYLKIAEEHGLIDAIDRWVITQAAGLAARGLPVELNVSGGSIGDPLLAHIESTLRDSGADPALMVFEITETALVADEEAGRRFAERVHQLGCKLALDDFGTGYGGFTYLKQLPVDYLKIDIEFVRDLCTSTASLHVVEAVVNLARGFGLRTVAEGVEDAPTLALLERLGVDFAQGYHIARPGPLDDIIPADFRSTMA